MLLSEGPSWRPWREQFREFAGLLSVKLRCPFLAEGVAKVRVIKFYTTLVRVRCACRNIDSMEPPFLNHCFKNLERRDFFNSLSQKRTERTSGGPWFSCSDGCPLALASLMIMAQLDG